MTDETIETPGPIDDPKTPADVRQEPYKLPKAFEWVSVNVENEDEVRVPLVLRNTAFGAAVRAQRVALGLLSGSCELSTTS